jgi:intracellular sulfur oxidation DsrE/DsrF family protein
MKRLVLVSLLIIAANYCIAQNLKAIKNYGNTFLVEQAELRLDKDTHYKVIFDIAKSADQKNKLNSSINTVARFINMHVGQGIPLENLEVVVVIHGAAVKDYTTDEVYLEKYSVENPNAGLIEALKEAGVRTYMCGQSFGYRGYTKEQLSEHAALALSAMTALVHFQKEGYQLIDFN